MFQHLNSDYEGKDCKEGEGFTRSEIGRSDSWLDSNWTLGKFFTRTIDHWNNLPVVEFSTLNTLDSGGQSAGPACQDCAFPKKD